MSIKESVHATITRFYGKDHLKPDSFPIFKLKWNNFDAVFFANIDAFFSDFILKTIHLYILQIRFRIFLDKFLKKFFFV